MSSVHEALNAFRLASRELFNGYFRVPEEPYANGGWSLLERFVHVEDVLFEQLVGAALEKGLAAAYGHQQPMIAVSLNCDAAPIMVNRDIDSGYWDHPAGCITREADMRFVRFFDWDQLAIRDNRYVRVVITHWPTQPELQGKHALLESQYAAYSEP